MRLIRFLALVISLLVSFSLYALPIWLPPGDMALRSDIQLLADQGVIDASTMTWPMTWSNVGANLTSAHTVKEVKKWPLAYQVAYRRVLAAYKYSMRQEQASVFMDAAHNVNQLRTFYNGPRDNVDAGAQYARQGSWWAFNFAPSYGRQTWQYNTMTAKNPHNVAEATAQRDFHLDGSYADLLMGNWSLGYDVQNRWWGPGYSDSQILSENARPFKAVALNRIHDYSFQSRWLSWLGPWNFQTFVGQLGQYRYEPSPFIWGLRFSFKPTSSLQFSLGKNLVFAGSNRSITGKMLLYALTFRTNCGFEIPKGQCKRNEPGYNIADADFRWDMSGLLHFNSALYGQITFDDMGHWGAKGTAGGKIPSYPIKGMYLLGLEHWQSTDLGLMRNYFEYETTTGRYHVFSGKYTNKIYSNSIYRSGYYFDGQCIGSSLCSDSEAFTLGSILQTFSGHAISASVRYVGVNRNHGTVPNFNSFRPANLIYMAVGDQFMLPRDLGLLGLNLGYIDIIKYFKAKQYQFDIHNGVQFAMTWKKELG